MSSIIPSITYLTISLVYKLRNLLIEMIFHEDISIHKLSATIFHTEVHNGLQIDKAYTRKYLDTHL